MTPQEFKAWFEGFTEAFDRIPTKAQWARVKERVAEIDGKPVTERVFVDRYWPTYINNQFPPYPRPYWQQAYATCSTADQAAAANASSYVGLSAVGHNSVGVNTVFNSSAAMIDLGRADAKALAT